MANVIKTKKCFNIGLWLCPMANVIKLFQHKLCPKHRNLSQNIILSSDSGVFELKKVL
jgi:hypothetical protein